MNALRDFEYGDPLADAGTEGWAKRTRVVLLSKVDGTKFSVHDLKCHLDAFFQHRGWAKLDRGDGKKFVHFREFVESPKPWGLGTAYDRFRALIASEIGEREFDRLTASEGEQGARSDLTSGHGVPKLDAEVRRTKRLRAVNRAPPVIQRLYDDDLLAVALAAKFGPKPPKDEAMAREKKAEMERRADALQARLESAQVFQPNMPHRRLKQRMNEAAREILALKPPDPFEQVIRMAKKLSAKDKQRLKRWANENLGG
jgi:hypothetical protein